MLKRTISILLVTLLMLSVMSVAVFSATIVGGPCGDAGSDITWYIVNNTELLLSGTGKTKNYSYTSGTYAPWRNYKDKITKVTVSDGITQIGEYCFFEFSKLKTLDISEDVTYIGKDAFKLCTALTEFTAPAGITEITRHLFHDCYALEKVILHKNITTIHSNAFENCDALTVIEYASSDKDFEKIKFEDREGKELYDFNPDVEIEFKGGHTHVMDVWVSDNNKDCRYEPTESSSCTFKFCNYRETRVNPEASSLHWFAYYIYDENEGYGKNATETATCQYGCGTKNTREKEGTALVDSAKRFKDVVKGKWYTKYVDIAVGRGLFDGTSETTFEPNTAMTRAMFVTVLARMGGSTVSNDVAVGFKDVPKGKWFTGAVKWAVDGQIVNGVNEYTFEPNSKVTREQLCAMLIRYANFMGISVNSKTDSVVFTDDKKIANYAYNSVYLCQRGGLINGVGDGSFAPKKTATRAEVAKILSLFCQYNLRVSYEPPPPEEPTDNPEA